MDIWTALMMLFVGGMIGSFVTRRSASADFQSERRILQERAYYDQRLYVRALAREYAQILFTRCTDEFLAIEEKTFRFIREMGTMNHTEISQILNDITDRYRTLSDFDKVNLREFVIFELDRFSLVENELQQAYFDCCVYSIFLKAEMQLDKVSSLAANLAAKYDNSHWDEKEPYILGYSREYKDLLFIYRCVQAMRECSAVLEERSRIIRSLENDEIVYNRDVVCNEDRFPLLYTTKEFEIYYVSDSMVSRHGIRFYDTGECVVQEVYIDDDDRVFVIWQRSDDKFLPLDGRASRIEPLVISHITIPFDFREEMKKYWLC